MARKTFFVVPALLASVFFLTIPVHSAIISHQLDHVPELIQVFADSGDGAIGTSCLGGACDLTIPFSSGSSSDDVVVVTLLDPFSGAVNDILTFEEFVSDTTAELSFFSEEASFVLGPSSTGSAARTLLVIDRGGDQIMVEVGSGASHMPEPSSLAFLAVGMLAVASWGRFARKSG